LHFVFFKEIKILKTLFQRSNCWRNKKRESVINGFWLETNSKGVFSTCHSRQPRFPGMTQQLKKNQKFEKNQGVKKTPTKL
jgi:hypothetical protein